MTKMNGWVCGGMLAAMLGGFCGAGWAQGVGAMGKRPMTFADLQRMKRVSDPQISPSGRWVMFSVVDVDLEKNSKVSHLWVVPMGGAGGREADSSAALRNDKQGALRNDKQGALRNDKQKDGDAGADSGASSGEKERQVTFWKEGESGGRFSPDGRQVLFVATDGANNPSGLSQIFLAPWDEATGTLGTPQRLTNVSTEADGAIWSPDSRRILFVSRVYPGCSDEPVWVEEDNCDRKQDEAAAANPVKAQIWTHLLYRHWDHYVGPKRSHVLVVSATDGNAVRDLTPRREIGDAEAPTFSLGGPMGYAWAPDSKEIAFVTNLDLVPAASTNNDVFTLRLDDAAARPVKISTSLGSDDGPAYSPDGKWLAFRSQARAGYESDRFRLMLFDRHSRRLTNVELKMRAYSGPPPIVVGSNAPLPATAAAAAPEHDLDRWVDEFIWASDSQRIFFAASDAGQEIIYGTNVPSGNLHRYGKFAVVETAGEWSSLIQVGPGYRLAGILMRADKPAEVAIANMSEMDDSGFINMPVVSKSPSAMREYNLREGVPLATPNYLTHMNDAVFGSLDLPKMESYWFTGAEGAKVQGFVIRPPGFDASRKYPLKFLIHGGPQGAWGDAWSYRWNPELMAASGYVVVMVNPRGSTGYGQAFIDGVNGDWGGKAYVDLMKGLDAAEAKFPFIDKSRECALGASYGGFMADWILTHTDRFACIVTHDGMFNPQSAYGDTEELWFNEWEFRRQDAKGGATAEPGQPWRYAAGSIANDPFRRWSPMLSIQNAKTPTLVIHSQRDYRLDVSEGMQLFTALQRLNVPSKMLYFPDEGHWILKPQNSKLWYETVGDWCDRWTKTNTYALVEPYVAPPAPVAPRAAANAGSAPKTKPAPQAAPAPAPLAAAAVARGQSVPDAEPVTIDHASFSIAISVPQDEVRIGLDVPVRITLKNVSSRQITFGHRPGVDHPEFSYEIVVKNAKGQIVEETAYGREASDARRRQEEDRTVDFVQPGGNSVQTAHLAKLVEISRPGWYTVQVSRKDRVTGETVRSNEAKIAVVP
jgi:dipeptidyl aminopeptidase/acylaminoacyl peptidase